MKIKRSSQFLGLAVLALLLLPAAIFAEEQPVERGIADFGFRYVWGSEYGRPDLPFSPDPITSKYNEYSDRRSGFVVRRFSGSFDNILNSRNYVNLQSQSTFYKNQSYLASVGQYGKFKIQFRYDEIPHIYSNTSRLLYTQTSPGVYTLPVSLKTSLQTASSTGTAAQINSALPAFMVTQVTCGIAIPPATQPPACSTPFYTPNILRKAGTVAASYYVTPDWIFNASFMRENQVGSRPFGLILNSSPSASASGQPTGVTGRQSPGTGAELPEPINYFNNLIKIGTEYGRKDWAFQLGFTGSIFSNNVSSLLFDNPFATADIPVQIIAPGTSGCPGTATANCTIGAVPAHGQVDLYPNNRAYYGNFAGAMDLGKYARVMATVNPGWLYQDEAFLPYTANTAITGLAALPSSSLHGSKQTLAMNYTLIANPLNNVQLKAAYRHYDYHNHTASRDFTPVEGDTLGANAAATGQAAPGIVDNSPFGFEKKNLELTGQWFFAKRSSVKAGWEGEWFDRSHRDADSSFESSVFGAVDYSPKKDLLLRVAYRHQNRKPDVYQDEEASDAAGNPVPCTDTTTTFFTAEQRCHRRFDEAARLLDRVDTLVQYSYKQLTVSGGFQTLQSDYNRSGDTNSPTPLNFLTGAAATTGPYYLYGALKDIAFIYTGDASYAFSKAMSVFAEYTHELYHKRMISRSRTPTSGAQTILTCNGCDTPNNDWESTYRDVFDTFALGTDLFLGKKVYFTTYYSLSAGKGNVISRALGDPTIVPGQNCPAAPAPCPNQFTLTGTSAAQNYPETTTRIHEVSAVFKYKLTKNIMPRVEYRYQQFDNRDYQTTAMTPYMGCIGTTTMNPALAPPCPAVGANVAVQSPSQFYPFFVVGDTASARYLFMGVDQPSYGVHSITATVEYRF